MLTININGAKRLLNLLNSISKANPFTEVEIMDVLSTNQFFMNFYSRCKGVTNETLIETIYRFNQLDFRPSSPILIALAKGFQKAIKENERMHANLNLLEAVNPTEIVNRVLPYLPDHTQLQSIIHITIDGFNGGCQFRGNMGWSLLNDMSSLATFESGIAHELHHVGFSYWAGSDPYRQKILNENSGRSIAIKNVQNLLSEGLAMFFCSPDILQKERVPESNARKLADYRQHEHILFAQTEKVLELSLLNNANFDTCLQAFEAIAIDLDGILPVSHYLGARMIETMNRYHPLERIIECQKSLSDFLPLYNQAAQKMEAFVFNPSVVEHLNEILKNRKY